MKLMVKLASFGLEKRGAKLAKGIEELRKAQTDVPEVRSIPKSGLRDSRLYGEVVTGRNKEVSKVDKQGRRTEDEIEVEVPVAEGAVEWLSKCAVGTLRSADMLPDFLSWVEKEKHMATRIRLLGDARALIEFHSQAQMEYNVVSVNHSLHQWFESLNPWNPIDAKRKRRVWLKCMDVPLQVWGDRFFSLVGNYWGKSIMVDQKTTNKEDIEVGRILIATDEVETINVKVRVWVEGELFIVRVAEESVRDEVLGVPSSWKEPTLKQRGGSLSEGEWVHGREDAGKVKVYPVAADHGTDFSNSNSNLNPTGTRVFEMGCAGGEPNQPDPKSYSVANQAHSAEALSKPRPRNSARPTLEAISSPVDESPDELRSIFVNHNLLSDDIGSRVEDSLCNENGVEGLESRSIEEKLEHSNKGVEEGEWVRVSREEKRASRRKRVPIGPLLGSHIAQYRRSRSRKGRSKKNRRRGEQDLLVASDQCGSADESKVSESEVDGVNKSVSEDTIKKLNVREKPKMDTAWETGKKLGLNILGSEEKLIDAMANIAEQDNRAYEEYKINK